MMQEGLLEGAGGRDVCGCRQRGKGKHSETCGVGCCVCCAVLRCAVSTSTVPAWPGVKRLRSQRRPRSLGTADVA